MCEWRCESASATPPLLYVTLCAYECAVASRHEGCCIPVCVCHFVYAIVLLCVLRVLLSPRHGILACRSPPCAICPRHGILACRSLPIPCAILCAQCASPPQAERHIPYNLAERRATVCCVCPTVRISSYLTERKTRQHRSVGSLPGATDFGCPSSPQSEKATRGPSRGRSP